MFVVLFFVASVGADVVNSKGQCRLDQHPSVEYRCILTGAIKSSRVCDAVEPAGTIVSPHCRRPNYYSSTPLTFMRCFDGYWDHIERCSPECGKVTPDGKGLVVGGKDVKRGELPWHAGIYSTGTDPYMQVCGGSLISKIVVLSAAHCFWTELENQLPASKFSVAVGKLYRPWNDNVDHAQKSKVKVIHLPERYQGISANYQEDIAVVIVAKEFEFKTYIRPVCLSFDYHFEKQQLYAGNNGKVAGWGLTAANGKPSPVLQVVDLPYVEVRTCINMSPPEFREYITSDKICAGTLEPNSALCKGDSGGGLAFPESIRGVERYYLRGIVSAAPTSDNACNTDTYTSFTSVLKHEHFIKQFWSEFGQFKCQDGSFITAVNYCDGTKECPDGSDETSWACSSKICSSYLFQCAYGACVDRGAPCNGIEECADGSDEAQELCETSTSTVTEPTTANCVLPPYPQNGTYVSNTAEVYPGGAFKNVTLEYSCRQGYVLLGSESLTCQDGVWRESVPQCVRLCRLDSHPSVEYRCVVSGEITGSRKCKEYEPDGTIVIPKCNKPNYYSSTTLNFMRCIDGYWDYIAICTPECGTVTPKGMELVIGGLPAKKGEVPWHAGIYTKTYNPYKLLCGGSLISSTLIISSAICFWSDVEKQLPASQFAVAVGKLYRPWNDIKDEAQKSDVKKINLPLRYQGALANYQDNIAVVEVAEAFVYTTFIRPVCINFDVNFERQQLQPNNKGKVAGWGLTAEDGKPSPVLQVIDLPYVDIGTCIANSPPSFREYITGDNICAGTLEQNSALCRGDSGGGLAFPTTERGIERFYLRGIVSTAPNNEHTCNTAVYTYFTQITKHKHFIKQIWTVLKPRG